MNVISISIELIFLRIMLLWKIRNFCFRCELRECIALISPINGNMKCQRHPNAFPLASLSISDPIDNLTHAKV